MGLLDKARLLESRISRVLTRAAEDAVGSSEREPLEIAHAIVDEVEREIQPGGRGARIFPFNRVAVSLLAPSPDERARLEAIFAAGPSLRDRIVARLQSARCDAADLHVEVACVARPGKHWSHPQFHVAFGRIAAATAAAPAPAPARPARIDVTVVHGAAERRHYSFTSARIDLGRGAEVRDSRHRLLRANHVVFVEGSASVNQTVSRRHAHIAIDPESGDVRLQDDHSVHGTGIVRSGRTIPVPTGSRGVRLHSGDEIVLGEARVRIGIEEPGMRQSGSPRR
jgi:pSer/pThr/pTyr-binding forkhead associated (FHA) protein